MNKSWAIILVLIVSAAALVRLTGRQPGGKEGAPGFSGQTLMVFAGVASKPPVEKIARIFEAKTGANVNFNFGGSGKMLSEMELAKQGDIYFPASSNWMQKAKERKIVLPETARRVVYLVSAINVQKGNPKNIRSLKDLLRPGVRVAIANPENVAAGSYAVEILEKNFTPAEIKRFREQNLVNYPESAEKSANAISLKAVDAVIGWSVFEAWDPKRIQTKKLNPAELIHIGDSTIAVSKFSQNRRLAQAFINFVTSPKGLAVFKKHGYFTTVQEAQDYASAKKALPVGGWYDVPKEWLNQ